MESRRGYQPTGPHPRHQPHRFNPLPFIAAGGVVLVLLVAVVGLAIARPWVSNATPTPIPTPVPTLPPLPSPTDTPVANTPAPDVTDAPTPVPGPSMKVYVVQAGDTFSSIARKFGLTRAQLQAANPQITNVNSIHVGQKIYIPSPVTATPAQPTGTPTGQPTVTPAT